jgi:hypothetical protein
MTESVRYKKPQLILWKLKMLRDSGDRMLLPISIIAGVFLTQINESRGF